MGTLTAYSSSRDLAREVCFVMCSSFGANDVKVTEVKGMGWAVECQFDQVNFDILMGQLRGRLKRKFDKISWNW